ncbi:type VI secretion system baseplate subunit TssG [Serratia marcescens]
MAAGGAARAGGLKAGRGAPRLGESAFSASRCAISSTSSHRAGPMPQQDYDRFLPGAELCRQLRDWVRQYLGIEFVWEVRLILAKEQAHGIQLGGAQRLG